MVECRVGEVKKTFFAICEGDFALFINSNYVLLYFFFFFHARLVESFEQNCRRAQAFSLVAVVGDNSTDTEDDARWTRGPRALMATDGWVGGIRTGSAGGSATTKTGRGIAASDAARIPVSLYSFAPVHVTPPAQSVRSFVCMTSPEFWIDLFRISAYLSGAALLLDSSGGGNTQTPHISHLVQ